MVRPVKRYAQTVARRFVHLAVDQRHLVQHAAFFHLVIEVVAFAGTLADAGEHRIAAVLDRDVADQLHHVHGLAHAGAAEQADLAALGERQIRSITLMPVSSSSVEGDSSSKAGALR